ncbi:ABC transporter substrate-binding protein [Gilliamella apicola]|uniref:ABC transporter substrate-binding protein n=1 Tax=Gilliamella apicola TaxID=1196095 RepID=A0A556RTJ8_9GAMM|nr:ABC transporter substrate-binding protein [Gilliamella apicola]TSJ92188.1 ABC transporter substrate-binding protein [Gilliamella apicola]
MNIKKKVLLNTLIAFTLGLTGCQSSITVNPDNKQSVVVPKSPSKVVVMNYGALDTLDALGKGSIVTGIPLSVLPSYLEQYKSADITDTGNMKEPNIEVIARAKPQLIIIDGRQANRTEVLNKIAPVINLSVDAEDYLESTKNHINMLANITGTEKIANNLIQSLEAKVSNAQSVSQASNKKAIVAIHNDGKMILINVSSSAALIHDVLQVKRAVPLAPQPTNGIGKPKPTFIDNSYISKVKPDIIYVVDRSKAIGQSAMKGNFFDSKVLAKNQTKVVYLTPDLWYLSGGGAESLDLQIDEVIDALK